MAGLRGEQLMNLERPILVTGASDKTGQRAGAWHQGCIHIQ
jgi:hypothetical protein